MIASLAFFVLDGVLGWPVELYDGSWSQWGQMSANTAKGGQLNAGNPWTTDIPSRSSLVVYNLSEISDPLFTGSGSNDLATSVAAAITTDRYYKVQISGIAPDAFIWSMDGGATWDPTPVTITAGVPQAIGAENALVTFASGTGHVLNDSWYFTAGAKKAVELLSADGSTCSGTLAVDGVTKTYSPSLCTPAAPSYYDASMNKIEEEDAAFMGSGAGGSGGGGGGPATGC